MNMGSRRAGELPQVARQVEDHARARGIAVDQDLAAVEVQPPVAGPVRGPEGRTGGVGGSGLAVP